MATIANTLGSIESTMDFRTMFLQINRLFQISYKTIILYLYIFLCFLIIFGEEKNTSVDIFIVL